MHNDLIFVVEDDPIISKHLRTLLINLGYKVAGPVMTGEEAVEKIPHTNPDIILMDISLAGKMDGIQAADLLRSKVNIPIIYLTEYADEGVLQRAKVTDPFGYLIKPFDERALHITIEMASHKYKLEAKLKESENRFRTLVEQQGEGVAIVDPHEIFIFANSAAENIFGVSTGKLVGRSIAEFVDDKQLDIIQKQTANRKKRQKSVYEINLNQKEGESKNVLITTTSWFDENNNYIGAFGVFRDMSEDKKLRQAEAEQRKLAEALIDITSALNSTLVLDKVFDLILENVGRVVPHDSANIMLLENGFAYVAKARGYEKYGIRNGIEKLKVEIEKTPNIRTLVESHQACIVKDVQKNPGWKKLISKVNLHSYIGIQIEVKGKVVGIISLLKEEKDYYSEEHGERLKAFANQAGIAIENARIYSQMQELAHTDELTGISNRRGIIDLGKKELNRSYRFHHPMALIWIDFDYYKKINDAYGHDIGDQVLRFAINDWRKDLRDIDLIGRMGGDEFVVILPETNTEAALMVAERLRTNLKNNPPETSVGKIVVTSSFGVTGIKEPKEDFSKMLSRADNAMYIAKEAGRDQVRSL